MNALFFEKLPRRVSVISFVCRDSPQFPRRPSGLSCLDRNHLKRRHSSSLAGAEHAGSGIPADQPFVLREAGGRRALALAECSAMV
ncbi:hypothetical protein VU07_02255 [Desulfobulbus sp. F4]|nr:hypothetical protein [Desulfobulbus sp. F4]